MPLTKHGKKLMSKFQSEYGTKKGKSIFYASKNAGRITGVDKGFYGHMSASKTKQMKYNAKGSINTSVEC